MGVSPHSGAELLLVFPNSSQTKGHKGIPSLHPTIPPEGANEWLGQEHWSRGALSHKSRPIWDAQGFWCGWISQRLGPSQHWHRVRGLGSFSSFWGRAAVYFPKFLQTEEHKRIPSHNPTRGNHPAAGAGVLGSVGLQSQIHPDLGCSGLSPGIWCGWIDQRLAQTDQ